MDAIEEWRPCPGYLNYEVSSLGRFRFASTQRVRRQLFDRRGYPLIIMSSNGSHATMKTLHCAGFIAEAFLGKRPKGMQIDHIDGNKANEAVTNLEYVTMSENIQRSYGVQGLRPVERRLNGRYSYGEKVHKMIHDLVADGHNQCQTARIMTARGYPITNSGVSRIVSGRSHPRWFKSSLEEVAAVVKEHPDWGCHRVGAALGITKSCARYYLTKLKKMAQEKMTQG